MTQINPPGYPLPDGELGEDELVCQLIYLPDRPEYWQALLAAVHYFSTWKAWERDGDKRGKDAAANWREAFELTIGCWRMTCLEELTQTVTDILELLQTKKDCCDDNITFLPVDDIETDIVPFEGDAPELYGETEIADWDEWAEHVCYNAHLYVDYLAHAGDTIWDAAKLSAIAIGVIAAILASLVTLGIGAPVAWTLAAGITSGIFLGGTVATFAGSHDAIEAARDDIVCAIINGTGIATAVEEALESGLDWDLFYSLIPYNSAMAIIYEGGHDSEFLSSETREDCECEEEPDLGPFEEISGGVCTILGYKTPPACEEDFDEIHHIFSTVDECASSFYGVLRVVGELHVLGDMDQHTNCIGDMDLQIRFRPSGHVDCEHTAMDANYIQVYNDGSQATGAQDFIVEYDIETEEFFNIRTLDMYFRVNTRYGNVDMTITNTVLLIEEVV